MALSSITAIYSASDTLPCEGPAKYKRNNLQSPDENSLRNPHKFTFGKGPSIGETVDAYHREHACLFERGYTVPSTDQ